MSKINSQSKVKRIEVKLKIHHQAQVFAEMICRWGMVAGSPDGEDSSGRSKMKLLEPADVIARAEHMTHLYFEVAKVKGWIEVAK